MIARVALACASLVGASCAESERTCESDPQGGYAIDFKRALFACERDAFPEDIVLDADAFSSDGCELRIDGAACVGGPGFCGALRWVEAGTYEGSLSYATMINTGNSGGLADCLVHSEEAELTSVDD
jgi:hypothetical protein